MFHCIKDLHFSSLTLRVCCINSAPKLFFLFSEYSALRQQPSLSIRNLMRFCYIDIRRRI
ncbi:hypothetical protein CW304_06590 [Bacillus sp. UFRGS-B20]|nr:hypothetical protein CW304_06590 [Bacillus sp. UFRGS-B20]